MQTINGAYTLHDFRIFNWEKWHNTSAADRQAAWSEWKMFLQRWETPRSDLGSQAMYAVIGKKADFLFLCLRPTLEEVQAFETAFQQTLLSHFMIRSSSYLSVVEKNTYANDDVDALADPELQKKLYPGIPEENFICFYPMGRRREGMPNWFTLSNSERGQMMYKHIATVKPYNEQIKRIVTGAIGFESYDWGISLFADDAIHFKNLLHASRFDEVIAKYTVYGPFYTGSRLTVEALSKILQVKKTVK